MKKGFTMVEMILTLTILSVVMMLSFLSFDAVVGAWKAGSEFSENTSYADFVMDQLAMGLRSAYYPDAQRVAGDYGFQMEDNGNDDRAADKISWTKIGAALVGEEAPYAGTPHRIEAGMFDTGTRDEKGFGFRAWRQDFNLEDFDPSKIEPVILSTEVIGFNCKMLDPEMSNDPDADLEWVDVWEGDYTNRLPRVVELTLYVENPEKARRRNADPVAIRRLVTIPVSYISWGEKRAARGTGATSNPPPSNQPNNPPGGGR